MPGCMSSPADPAPGPNQLRSVGSTGERESSGRACFACSLTSSTLSFSRRVTCGAGQPDMGKCHASQVMLAWYGSAQNQWGKSLHTSRLYRDCWRDKAKEGLHLSFLLTRDTGSGGFNEAFCGSDMQSHDTNSKLDPCLRWSVHCQFLYPLQ